MQSFLYFENEKVRERGSMHVADLPSSEGRIVILNRGRFAQNGRGYQVDNGRKLFLTSEELTGVLRMWIDIFLNKPELKKTTMSIYNGKEKISKGTTKV